jgi:hypothetical protein
VKGNGREEVGGLYRVRGERHCLERGSARLTRSREERVCTIRCLHSD